MKRDVSALRKKDENKSQIEFDLLIVGAGIYGSTMAWEASLRGLKVALIDKGDFGGETSSNSLKIFHGGLRSLQRLDIKLMRMMIGEQRNLRRIAPHLVHPMPVVMPVYKNKIKGKMVMRAALVATNIVGFDRNKEVHMDKILPSGTTIDAEKTKKMLPLLPAERISGAALWHDALMHDSERLTLAFVQSAESMGAVPVNYVKAEKVTGKNGKVTGVLARDLISGKSFSILSKKVVMSAGPWIDNLLEMSGLKKRNPEIKYYKSINLILNKKLFDVAAGLSPTGVIGEKVPDRMKSYGTIFAVPWKGKTIVGVEFIRFKGNPDNWKVTETEILDLIEYVNLIVPKAKLSLRNVDHVLAGLLPRAYNEKSESDLMKHHVITNHKTELDGFYTVTGVKYTTSRYVAKEVIDLITKDSSRTKDKKKVQNNIVSSRTPLIGGHMKSFETYMKSMKTALKGVFEEKVIEHLVQFYGTKLPEILELVEKDKKKARVIGKSNVIEAEITNSVRNEMAIKLTDIIFRRTGLGSSGTPGKSAIKRVAEITAKELKWSKTRIKKEINEVYSVYERLSIKQ